MSKPSSPSGGREASDDLEGHLRRFLSTFATAGYAKGTRDDKRRAVMPFARWVRRRRVAVADLNEACVLRTMR